MTEIFQSLSFLQILPTLGHRYVFDCTHCCTLVFLGRDSMEFLLPVSGFAVLSFAECHVVSEQFRPLVGH